MQHPSRYCGAGWPARPAEWVTYTLVNRRPEFQSIRTGCGALFHDVMHYLVDWHWMVPDLCNEGCGRRQKDRHCRGCCAASVDEPANENETGSVTLISSSRFNGPQTLDKSVEKSDSAVRIWNVSSSSSSSSHELPLPLRRISWVTLVNDQKC